MQQTPVSEASLDEKCSSNVGRADFSLAARSVSAGSAFRWIKEGFRQIGTTPWRWSGYALLISVILSVSSLLRDMLIFPLAIAMQRALPEFSTSLFHLEGVVSLGFSTGTVAFALASALIYGLAGGIVLAYIAAGVLNTAEAANKGQALSFKNMVSDGRGFTQLIPCTACVLCCVVTVYSATAFGAIAAFFSEQMTLACLVLILGVSAAVLGLLVLLNAPSLILMYRVETIPAMKAGLQAGLKNLTPSLLLLAVSGMVFLLLWLALPGVLLPAVCGTGIIFFHLVAHACHRDVFDRDHDDTPSPCRESKGHEGDEARNCGA